MLNQHERNALTPGKTLEILKNGNRRFYMNQRMERDLTTQVLLTLSGQFPAAIVLSCIDSRVPAELIFDQGIGDIFNARIPGNFINDDILGSMEFACKLAGVKLIVVMGHTSCGAVKAACDHIKLGYLTGLLKKIEPAVEAVNTPEGVDRSSNNEEFVNAVALKNIELTIQTIKRRSTILNSMLANKEIGIAGALYHIEDGKVEFFEQDLS